MQLVNDIETDAVENDSDDHESSNTDDGGRTRFEITILPSIFSVSGLI